MKRSRVKLAIALVVLVSGLLVCGLVHILSVDKASVPVKPGTIVYQPHQTVTPFQPSLPMQQLPSVHRYARMSPHQWTYPQPVTQNGNTPFAASSHAYGVYMTSNAQVHSIGGGANGQTMASSSYGSSDRGVPYSGAATMPMTNFLALASSHQMAQPEAQEAPQMASMASGPRHAPGPPNPPGPLPEDNQLVEHPLGDAMWPLLILAMGYIVVNILYRRKRSK